MRIARGLKCALDPHVVCALRYGSKSGRGLPSNPTPANCNPLPGATAMQSPQPDPPPRTEPGVVPDRKTAAKPGDPHETLRRLERSSSGGALIAPLPPVGQPQDPDILGAD